MNPLMESEKSSAKPSKPPKARKSRSKKVFVTKTLWQDWNYGEIKDVEYNGEKFQAVKSNNSGYMYTGTKLVAAAYHMFTGYTLQLTMGGDQLVGAGSCAYARVFPDAHSKRQTQWTWWLNNIHLTKATIAFVTRLDAGYPGKGWEERLEKLHQTLKNRGFKEVAVTPSIHEGNYPVWLYTHPGDKVRNEKNNKKKNKVVKSDVNVLGNSDASNPEPGVAGDIVAGPAPAPAVQNAPAIVEIDRDADRAEFDAAFRYALSA